MAIGSGLAGSAGVAAQGAYGTYTAPSRHFRATKASAKHNQNVVQGGGMAAGQAAQPGAFRAITDVSGTGALELEVPTTGFGLLLAQIFGPTPAPVQVAATTAYSQTFDFGDNIGRALSLQVGVPNLAGTVVPFTGVGGKVTSAEFSCERGGLLQCTLELDFRNETEAQALAAPSYVAGQLPFTFRHLAVKLGASFGSEVAVDGVRKVSFKVERGHDTERVYAGANGLKAEPIWNAWAKVSGSIEADFLDKAVFVDRFTGNTPTALQLAWQHTALAGAGNPFALELSAPQVFFDGDTPELESADVVKGSFDWVAQLDQAAPSLARARYVSTDTVL